MIARNDSYRSYRFSRGISFFVVALEKRDKCRICCRVKVGENTETTGAVVAVLLPVPFQGHAPGFIVAWSKSAHEARKNPPPRSFASRSSGR